MPKLKCYLIFVCLMLVCFGCTRIQTGTPDPEVDYSGTYCLNLSNQEMTIVQQGEMVTFSLQSDLLRDGTGTVRENSIALNAVTQDAAAFSSEISFSEDRRSFSGLFEISGPDGEVSLGGVLYGEEGECPQFDYSNQRLPYFVHANFTDLAKIEQISKFRSGFGHNFTDGTEGCRSMKHYFSPYAVYRENDLIEIYAPVSGTIISVMDDGHGASIGLDNKLIQIRSEEQPGFTFEIFHLDLISSQIVAGKSVQAGELLGYARMFYDDLGEHATSFDLAVWVNTPSGARLVSYFDLLDDDVFDQYMARGVSSRDDLIISRDGRDADPLDCNGEVFISQGSLENWFVFP